jgi:hypothetical protein
VNGFRVWREGAPDGTRGRRAPPVELHRSG